MYRCKHCKSTDVEGTLPAWFKVNTPNLEQVSVDVEAEYEFGYCAHCDESDYFHSIAERVTDAAPAPQLPPTNVRCPDCDSPLRPCASGVDDYHCEKCDGRVEAYRVRQVERGCPKGCDCDRCRPELYVR